MSPHLPTLAALLVLLSACKAPDPAPEELSELLRFAWSHYDLSIEENDISLADAGVNFQTWFEQTAETAEGYDPAMGFGATLTEVSDRLDDDVLAALVPAPEIVDGEAAVGVVVAIRTICTPEEVDALYLRDDQMELFPDNYLEYSREDQFYDCYLADECEEAGWVSTISNELPLNVTATFRIHNRVRKIDAEAPDGTPVNARLLLSWMLEEAEMDPASIGKWFQNYQLEYILETDTGTIHIYPQWVHVQLGELNTEANAFLNNYIDGIREYIQQLETHCG